MEQSGAPIAATRTFRLRLARGPVLVGNGKMAAARLRAAWTTKNHASKATRTVELRKIPVEGAKRQMPGFAGDFQYETIGKAQ